MGLKTRIFRWVLSRADERDLKHELTCRGEARRRALLAPMRDYLNEPLPERFLEHDPDSVRNRRVGMS